MFDLSHFRSPTPISRSATAQRRSATMVLEIQSVSGQLLELDAEIYSRASPLDKLGIPRDSYGAFHSHGGTQKYPKMVG